VDIGKDLARQQVARAVGDAGRAHVHVHAADVGIRDDVVLVSDRDFRIIGQRSIAGRCPVRRAGRVSARVAVGACEECWC